MYCGCAMSSTRNCAHLILHIPFLDQQRELWWLSLLGMFCDSRHSFTVKEGSQLAQMGEQEYMKIQCWQPKESSGRKQSDTYLPAFWDQPKWDRNLQRSFSRGATGEEWNKVRVSWVLKTMKVKISKLFLKVNYCQICAGAPFLADPLATQPRLGCTSLPHPLSGQTRSH